MNFKKNSFSPEEIESIVNFLHYNIEEKSFYANNNHYFSLNSKWSIFAVYSYNYITTNNNLIYWNIFIDGRSIKNKKEMLTEFVMRFL